MLQKLSGRAAVTPSFAADNPAEWDRKLSRTVHLKDKDILIDCCEHFTAESPHLPVSVCYRGPNQLVSSTYEEMLELLSIPVPDRPHAVNQATNPPTAEADILKVTAVRPRVEELSIDRSPPAPNPPAALVPVSSVPQKKPIREITMPKQQQYEEDYEANEEDDRPWPITKQTFGEIKNMSPTELQALLENLDDHEEWQDLRDTAKVRVAQWLGAIKKADEAPRCQFTKLNGDPCRSPAVKGETGCYYHGETRRKREAANALELPSLEDRLGVQLAIMRICNQLLEKSIDERTGRAVIAALRLAERNIGDVSSLL